MTTRRAINEPRVRRHASAVFAMAVLGGCGRLFFDPLVDDTDAALTPSIDGPTSTPDATPPPDLAFSLTADIQYVVSVGDLTSLHARIGEADNSGGAGISACPVGVGPERWEIQRAAQPTATHLYVATWDDLAISRGLVAQLRSLDGATSYTMTGDAGWEVCAVGTTPGDAGTLSDPDFTEGLDQCNTGTTASLGWVNAAGAVTPAAIGTLVVGGPHGDGVPLGPVCPEAGGVDLPARWVWYHPTSTDPAVALTATGGNDANEYLIFRYPLP